ELEEAEPPHRVEDAARRAVEELCANRDPPRLLGRDRPGHPDTVIGWLADAQAPLRPVAARDVGAARELQAPGCLACEGRARPAVHAAADEAEVVALRAVAHGDPVAAGGDARAAER